MELQTIQLITAFEQHQSGLFIYKKIKIKIIGSKN